MSWADKIHKQRQVDSLLREMMQRPEWKEEKKKIEEEAVVKSMRAFLLIGCDYMYRNFGCKKAGLRKWLEFACKQFMYVSNDSTFLNELNKCLEDEAGVNVLDELVIQEE